MKIGITGTRFGMTQSQDAVACALFASIGFIELHHGDCVGADAEAHDIADRGRAHITIHPPVDTEHRAYKVGHFTNPSKTHFARNREIVHACDILIAFPYNEHEEGKGGTWYTINYARKLKRWICIIWPSGKVTVENDPL